MIVSTEASVSLYYYCLFTYASSSPLFRNFGYLEVGSVPCPRCSPGVHVIDAHQILVEWVVIYMVLSLRRQTYLVWIDQRTFELELVWYWLCRQKDLEQDEIKSEVSISTRMRGVVYLSERFWQIFTSKITENLIWDSNLKIEKCSSVYKKQLDLITDLLQC